MTATKVANNETIKTEAPEVNVEVISSDTATDAVNDIKATTTSNRADTRAMEELLETHGQARELNNGYAEAGPFYASGAPVDNSFGCEFGVVTKDEKTGTVQRTGVGFYLRSDHLLNRRYDTTNTKLA